MYISIKKVDGGFIVGLPENGKNLSRDVVRYTFAQVVETIRPFLEDNDAKEKLDELEAIEQYR